jgi:hypothetical protein
MALERRLQQLEIVFQSTLKQPGCDITLFIVVPEDVKGGYFDTDTYKPVEGEIEKYLKWLKDSSQCRDCKGSCAIDWSPNGFKNHNLTGERSSSSSEPKLFIIYCADAEIPVLTRRIMSGE